MLSNAGRKDYIQTMLTTEPALQIDASKWNKAFTIDPIDIMLMLIDKRCFRGIFIQRQNPGKDFTTLLFLRSTLYLRTNNLYFVYKLLLAAHTSVKSVKHNGCNVIEYSEI